MSETGNSAELLIDGQRILPALLADLRAAQRNIHVSVFLIFRDPVGEEIADILIERAGAGVKVRVLLNIEKIALGDPFSTGEKRMMRHDPNVEYDPLDVRPLCKRMRDAGIEVHDTNIDYDHVIDGIDPRLALLAAQIRDAIDVDDLHVDHRKIIIIDSKVAYCGGANIGAQYLFHRAFDPTIDCRVEARAWRKAGDPEPWWKWHDSLTRFEGPVAAELELHFHARFVLDGGAVYEPMPALEGPPRRECAAIRSARVYRNVPDVSPNDVLVLYLERIAAAERSIFIENPYLYHPSIVDALCAAARPSLRITLVVPARRHNDNQFGQDAQEHHYARYLACGIEVWEYQHHFNHFKIAVFDERYSIHGSTNLNFRSLEVDKDFELVVLVDDEALARNILAQGRDVDIEHAQRIGDRDVHGKTWRALCRRRRNPWTLAMIWRREL
ncbi:MAG: phosphatidylserine/phosphatidylglycerophosphate/cardiolipin synthase family protein [Polyangia bacterium]